MTPQLLADLLAAVLLPAAAVVGGVGMGAAGVASLLRRQRVRRLRGQADDVRARVRQRYVTLDQRWDDLVDAAVVARGGLADDDGYAMQLEEERQQAADAMQAATSAYLQADSRHDPDTLDGADALQDALQRWEDLADLVELAHAEVDDVDAALNEIARARDRCQALLATLEDDLAAAKSALEQAAADGFRTELATAALHAGWADLDLGRAALQAARLWEATAALQRADDTARDLGEHARGLPHRQRSLLADHRHLTDGVQVAKGVVAEVAATVEELRADFPRSVWDPVDEAPAQAEAIIAQAGEALDAAADAATMEAQRFDEAAGHLAHATECLQQLHTIHEGVEDFRAELDALIAEYPQAHAAATAALAEARTFLAAHPGDVNPAHHRGLDRAAEVLADAERMAAHGRGDPNIAIHRLREVFSYTGAVLHAARTEKQQRDAHRDLASQLIRDAHRSVNRASSASGFGLFGWSARAKADLQAAQDALYEATHLVGHNPSRAEHLAVQAEQTALRVLAEHRHRRRVVHGRTW